HDPLKQVVEGWLTYQRERLGESVPSPDSDTVDLFTFVEQLDGIVRKEPEIAWLAIQLIYMDCKDDIEKAILAAGPLEDLLVGHGPLFVDRIEALAASDSGFRELLAGVWRNTIAPPVWERLQAVLRMSKH
ncbi:MAG: hypothetical protein H7346_11420, partial [Burkholderiaceae bacterium]|nr:hypothetical protein [Burkholderiaceae bacterium]